MYIAKQAHIVLADKMRARNKLTAPTIGDRVKFVVIKGQTGS